MLSLFVSSLGEYAAQVIAGVLTVKGALMLIANRAALMVQKCTPNATGMLAVNLSPDTVSNILTTLTLDHDFSGCTIACFNSPTDCVVSGPLLQLHDLRTCFTSSNIKTVLLNVPYGYHSPTMLPLLDDLTAVARQLSIRAPSIPIVSNVSGEAVMPGQEDVFIPEYYAKHCVEPVQFEKGIASLATGAIDVWLEIGPNTTTLPMLKANSTIVITEKTKYVGSMRKGIEPWVALASTLSQMYVAGVEVRWREVFECRDSKDCDKLRCISMPTYPFVKTRFWVPFKEDATLNATHHATPYEPSIPSAIPLPHHNLISKFAMLGSWSQHPCAANDNKSIFETPIEMVKEWIEGHRVGDAPLCPASVYGELVWEGVDCARAALGIQDLGTSEDGEESVVVLRDVEYVKPLVHQEGVERVMRTEIRMPAFDEAGSFRVISRLVSTPLSSRDPDETIHCMGLFVVSPNGVAIESARIRSAISTRIFMLISSGNADAVETFSTRTIYEVIFPRVVVYSEQYRAIMKLTVQEGGMAGYAVVRMPQQLLDIYGWRDERGDGQFVVHPVFTDT